jgi:hypothetical protein
MKNYLLLIFSFIYLQGFGQTLPDYFLDGKSVVLISNSPFAQPTLPWKNVASEIHKGLIQAGGDPVEYYELEQVILSEDSKIGFAEKFKKRNISSIIVCTRKSNGEVFLHIAPFTKDKNITSPGNLASLSGQSLNELNDHLSAIGKQSKTKNLLVLEIPEFINPNLQVGGNGSGKFLNRNPLNLDIFKLGIPMSGTSGDGNFLTSFRYDVFGKSQDQISLEQKAEKEEIEAIIKANYPYQVELLTDFKSDADLIKDRVQFVLMKSEAREGELKKNMGWEASEDENTRIVVKYYVKFLVRNELYSGTTWDADPDWKLALQNFLNNLSK